MSDTWTLRHLRCHARQTVGLSVLLLVLAARPSTGAEEFTLAVKQDRIYRVGAFLVVDALVANRSERAIHDAEVSVEFYTFFDELIGAEHTVLRPLSFGSGQVATLRVATPYTDAVRSVTYRFTWREAGLPFQQVTRRQVWAIGTALRSLGPSVD